ncbi:hypothetical protein BDV29DRAFT_153878 [Aspergillus leporis]|uniref:Transmembrane protein n=1 Tax=Aspergillus leporis TaxID=41062 RepID=A0A5N5XB90_9EURO|nr:hypothetical protein BDV29DRAFT_153878 [Aspergillus leporis]
MFLNITISLMSSDLLQPNYSFSAHPDVDVTIITYQNFYTYSKYILWTAYGTAIGATLASALLGCIAYSMNGGSYTTKFSTIWRTTRHAFVFAETTPEDCDGKDTLPSHIARARISFLNRAHSEEDPSMIRLIHRGKRSTLTPEETPPAV